MRILAIRGENLASLRRFDVNLDDPDGLGNVGLFAIIGPTGAGKSTLLDALCLALYDKTPRLGLKKSKHAVGRDPDDKNNLGAADVRNILRRGSARGFAEVDFVGHDGQQYRARWSVRRANDSPDGRLQKQKIVLIDLLDGQPLEDSTKSATLKRISDLVGLEFDQFRRSVLLAQGDFDAFLRADAGDRGALLERMTGTDIYKRLSIAAFERHKGARQAVSSIDERLQEHTVLSPARRVRLEAAHGDAASWVQAAMTVRGQAADDRRWHQSAQAQDAEITQAMEAADEADAKYDAAAPRRARIELARKAAPLEPLFEAADRAAAEANRRAAAHEQAQQATVRAQEHAAEARAATQAAEAAHVKAQSARRAAEDDLDAARGLDAELASARGDHARCAKRAEDAEHRAQKAQTQATAQNARRAELERRAAAASRTVAELATLEPLLASRARVRADATDWLVACEAARAAKSEIAAAAARLTEAETRHEAAKVQAKVARGQLDARKDALADQPTAALAEATDQARANREALAAEISHLKQMRGCAAEAVKLMNQHAEQRARIEAEDARRVPLEARRDAAERQMADLRVALESARADLLRSNAVKSLSAHRAKLHGGDPCPLCGATEHPGIDPALNETDRYDARVTQVESDIKLTQETLHSARAELLVIDSTVKQAQARSQEIDASLQAQISIWTAERQRASNVVPVNPTAPGALDKLAAHLTATEEAHAAATTTFNEARARQDARRAAEDEVSALRVAVDAAEDAVKDAGEGHHAAKDHKNATELKARDAGADADRAEGRARALLDRVDVDQLKAAPDATLDALEGRLDRLARALSDGREASAGLAALQGAAANADAEARAAALAVKDAHAQARASLGRVESLEARRMALLDGRSVATVRGALDAQVTEAAAALDAHRRETSKAEIEAEGTKARLGSATTARAEARAERAAADQRLHDALANAGLARAEVQSVRGISKSEFAAEVGALEALRAQRDKAHSVVEERCARRDAHDAQRPAVDAATADETLEAADRRYQDIMAAKLKFERDLDDDDAALTRCAALNDERAAAEVERALWGQLDEVIGSASGAKFREFAQSLTLDAVIEQANHHLRTLARRYQLMRVPKENLALQIVDRDMGDEVRTVKSLSGGETFLVSLALALGLASLSARDTRIGSLFIDEGFGTLDTGTLDVVIGVLEELQGNNRQIGLISHVPGLAQRIGAQVLVKPMASGLSSVSVTVSAGWQG